MIDKKLFAINACLSLVCFVFWNTFIALPLHAVFGSFYILQVYIAMCYMLTKDINTMVASRFPHVPSFVFYKFKEAFMNAVFVTLSVLFPYVLLKIFTQEMWKANDFLAFLFLWVALVMTCLCFTVAQKASSKLALFLILMVLSITAIVSEHLFTISYLNFLVYVSRPVQYLDFSIYLVAIVVALELLVVYAVLYQKLGHQIKKGTLK